MDREKCERINCDNESEYRRHSCPYQAELYGNDDEDYCNCCSDCRHECAMDV